MKQQTAKNNQIKLPHEVFDLVNAAPDVNSRVAILQEYSTFGIKTLLQINFKSNLKFDLPSGTPPYNQDKGAPGIQTRHFEKVIYDLKNLVVGSTVSRIKKEKLFITILETLHPRDSEILIAAKDKTLVKMYSSLTEATVRKAFPNLLPPK
jgi:hypothetical protein